MYSRQPTVDPQVAPKAALVAALGGSTDGADALLVARTQGIGNNRIRAGILDPALGLGGRTFTIDVDIVLKKRHYKNQAVIRLTGDPKRPYWILAWAAPLRA